MYEPNYAGLEDKKFDHDRKKEDCTDMVRLDFPDQVAYWKSDQKYSGESRDQWTQRIWQDQWGLAGNQSKDNRGHTVANYETHQVGVEWKISNRTEYYGSKYWSQTVYGGWMFKLGKEGLG